jgi:hypothetical protein
VTLMAILIDSNDTLVRIGAGTIESPETEKDK